MGLRVRLSHRVGRRPIEKYRPVDDAFDFTDVGWLGVERMTGCRGAQPMVVTIPDRPRAETA